MMWDSSPKINELNLGDIQVVAHCFFSLESRGGGPQVHSKSQSTGVSTCLPFQK